MERPRKDVSQGSRNAVPHAVTESATAESSAVQQEEHLGLDIPMP